MLPPRPSGHPLLSRTVAQHNQGSKGMAQGCQPLIPPRLEPFPSLSARVNCLIAEVGILVSRVQVWDRTQGGSGGHSAHLADTKFRICLSPAHRVHTA